MRVRMRLLAVLATVALLGAACGGDSGGDAGTTTTPPDGGNGVGEAQALTALDDEFNPADVTVDSGGTIDFRNEGENVHNFSITEEDISQDVAAGQSTTVIIDLEAGTYEFVCVYHEAAGMTGNLTVL